MSVTGHARPEVDELLGAFPQLQALSPSHAEGAARAFVTLSPDYFLSRFGVAYLAQTFWRVFSDDPDGFGFAWVEAGEVVGFVGGTTRRERFIVRVVRRAPVAFAWRLALACLRSPRFLMHGLGLAVALRREHALTGPSAELISLGVLPRALRPVTGRAGAEVSPSHVLVAAAASRLRERGVDGFRVYTGASNRLACAFYRRLGFREFHRLRLFGEEKICFVASVDAPGMAV